MENETRERLAAIGLDQKMIDNTMKGKGALQSLLDTLNVDNVQKCDKKMGNLLYTISQKIHNQPSLAKWRSQLAHLVFEQKIATQLQLDYAFEYTDKNILKPDLNLPELEAYCGVGFVVKPEDAKQQVAEFIAQNAQQLQQIRYTYNFSEYMKRARQFSQTLKFAEGSVVSKELKEAIEKLLGPKTELDQVKPKEEQERAYDISKLIARDMTTALNTEELVKARNSKFGDVILTRFPPEPNGYLHIGHAKAMRFNFTVASNYGGNTYLRYDDTNPEKECEEYIINIEENLRFLGYKPWKITHTSHYFDDLYHFAEELIKKDKAYTCFLSKEEGKELRLKKLPSPYRNTPTEESLRIFREMKMGLYKENEVCLRAKIDPEHPNPTLRDPPLYRIKYTPHPHVGDKWCIYPLYDYSHSICDSLEGITHSLCTLEFEIRRELYYWSIAELGLFKPAVWEYSRLNISNTVLSKRKLHKLIFDHHVSGWDDPRILTINGMRRRGYTADAINNFCDLVGVTRRGNENIIGMHVLEHCIRTDLDTKAKRSMAILDPVLATIVNLEKDEVLESNDFPKFPDKGKHQITLTQKIYLDRADVRLVDHEDFWGAAPGKLIGLKQCGGFKVLEILADAQGNVTEVKLERVAQEKPKGMLHWLSCSEGVECEIRLYDYLFEAYNPNELDDYINGLNPKSIEVFRKAQVHRDLLKSKKEEKYQFERLGYFCLDYDTNLEQGKLVWNRIVTLQDREKSKAMAKIEEQPVVPAKNQVSKKKEKQQK